MPKYYSRLSELSKKDENLQQSHSIEEAQEMSELNKQKENHMIEKQRTKKSVE